MSLRAELLAIVGKEDVTAVIQFVKNVSLMFEESCI